jgi:hypothetical protein
MERPIGHNFPPVLGSSGSPPIATIFPASEYARIAHAEGHSVHMEETHSLSPFKSLERDDPARIPRSRDPHPYMSDAYAAAPILKKERRPMAGKDENRDFFDVLSIVVL